MLFIELPKFSELIVELVGDDEFAIFQKELLKNPTAGTVIPGCAGLRKVRMRIPGRGKRGGARVIYLYLEEQATIVFFYLYTKAAAEDLSAEQKKRLQKAVITIKKEFKV